MEVTKENTIITCPDPETSHLDRHAYLFGHPIAHSMSPLFHQTIYDNLGLNWSQLPLPSTDMAHFLELIRHPQFFGKPQKTPSVDREGKDQGGSMLTSSFYRRS